MKLSVISKAILLSSIAVSAIGVANAKHTQYKDVVYKDQPCVRQCLKDGFYVGAQAGYDAFRARTSVTSADGTFSSTGSLTGWLGGLFVGYGQYIENFYLGGELVGNYNGSSQNMFSFTDDDGDNVTAKLKAKGTWGLSIVPGMRIQDVVLGYLRLGYNWTNFEGSFNLVNGTGGTASGSKSKTIGGWDGGIGLETLLVDNWSLRTEYNHIWYNSSNFGSAPGVSSNNNLSDNQFTLGVLYHFC